jgi:hypothetical protein
MQSYCIIFSFIKFWTTEEWYNASNVLW